MPRCRGHRWIRWDGSVGRKAWWSRQIDAFGADVARAAAKGGFGVLGEERRISDVGELPGDIAERGLVVEVGPALVGGGH